MGKIEQESYVIEFWPKYYKDVLDTEKPKITTCSSEKEALEVESAFHKVGWAARAIKIELKENRILLTSNRR